MVYVFRFIFLFFPFVWCDGWLVRFRFVSFLFISSFSFIVCICMASRPLLLSKNIIITIWKWVFSSFFLSFFSFYCSILLQYVRMLCRQWYKYNVCIIVKSHAPHRVILIQLSIAYVHLKKITWYDRVFVIQKFI